MAATREDKGNMVEAIEKRKRRYRSSLLIVLLLAIALIAWGGMKMYAEADSDGMQVQVIDGEGRCSFISVGDEGSYSFETKRGVNTIEIRDGSVAMVAADCPNQDCVHMASLCDTSGMILCLPNQLMVNIVSQESNSSDKADTVSS